MRIGIITNLYPPHIRGGAENVIVRTVGELLSLGHDVFVITGQPRKEGRDVKLDRSSTERIYRFFPKNIYFTLQDYQYPAFIRLFWHIIDAFSRDGAAKVEMILKDEQPDIVITHNLKGIGLNIPSVIRKLNIPHVHVVHDLQLIVPSGLLMLGHEREPWFAKIPYAIYRAICRRKIGNPDLVISPSHYLERMYKNAGFFKKTTLSVMPNPAPKYDNTLQHGRAQGPLKLLCLGQLGAHKGLLFLLSALEKYPGDIRLLLAGDGPLRKFVEEKSAADKRITYLGYMPPQEVVKLFGVADAVVVPSICYENSPTVIYEGLQAGIPILAARIGGVGELIQEGKNGYLFTPGDERDFCRALELLDLKKETFATSREEIRNTVHDYSLDSYAKRFVEVCEGVLKRHQE